MIGCGARAAACAHWSSVSRGCLIQSRDATLFRTCTAVAEDIGLVELVKHGLNSRGYNPGLLVIDPNYGAKSEHSIAVLQTWMREGAGDSHA